MAEPQDDDSKHSDAVLAPHSTGTSSPSQEITTRILDFLSTASNEKLGACALGLGVATYFALGRLGLVLIGAVGGVVLHATWEGNTTKDEVSAQAEQKRRKETSLEIVGRLLDWQSNRQASHNSEVVEESVTELNFDGFQPETSAALTHIVERVIDDYVKWWYSPLLPTELSFPETCRRTLTSFILTFSNHLAKKRAEDVFLNFLTNSTSIFIVFLGELSRALTAPVATAKEPADAIALYLTDHPDSSFANVLDRSEQDKKLKAVSEDILQSFLESKAYQFDPSRTFLKEVLAGLILEPTLVNCSKAEWINGWIVYLLEQGEPEIMNAINAGVGEATGKQMPAPATKQELPKDNALSTAEDEDDREALEEVRRLNALINAEQFKQPKEEVQPLQTEHTSPGKESEEAISSVPSTDNLLTPTSSQSDLVGSRSYTSLDEQTRIEQEDSRNARAEEAPMTSFDQIVPQEQLFTEPAKIVPLTLYKAVVTIFDDSQPGDKSTIRSKPSIDYLLQIEPASSQHPGWMIARKYTDFETLHEVLRRISVISGVPEFNNRFAVVPAWKGQTKNSLRGNLEAYLQEALSHERLAESEGMKRFLEKDQGLEKLGNSKGVLGFPSPEAFQTMGKGMLDVLTSAPKGAAGGGKALLDGMKGVGTVFTGQKKSSARPSQGNRTNSVSTIPRMSEDQSDRPESISEKSRSAEVKEELPASSRPSVDSSKISNPLSRASTDVQDQIAESTSFSGNASRVSFQHDTSVLGQPIPEDDLLKQSTTDTEVLNLPPRPDEIDNQEIVPPTQLEHNPTPLVREIDSERPSSEINVDLLKSTPEAVKASAPKARKQKMPFSTEETSVAVELIFATISELYTLSSVWNIRKALLNAAKAFIVRPGNPSLEQIRTLLQESVINSNTTDAGIAYQLSKLRENSLPTQEEFAAWPPPLSEEAKEKLRHKARKLLVEQGLPPALRGIMGAAATGEALGRLFDSLQVEEVSRGLMFAVMLQSLRAVTH